MWKLIELVTKVQTLLAAVAVVKKGLRAYQSYRARKRTL
jgi:hypothetical protein